MGNVNSLINVTLDKVEPAVYLSGDIIRGNVQFNITQRTKQIDEIYLSLTGDIGYTTTRTIRIQNGQMERKTDYHNIRIFEKKILLDRPLINDQTRIDINQNDIKIFEAGIYKYPFSIRLPENLPATLHPEDYPFVRYELQVLIEKKWYHSNDRHRYPIRIYPRVNLFNINYCQSSVKFGTKRKDITIKCILQHAALIPGQQTLLSLDIYNPNRLSIKRIDVCFIQRYEIEQCRRRLELIRLSIPQLNNIYLQHIETTCPLIIPLAIPPSFNYKSQINRTIVHVDLHYDLKLEIKLKGLFQDFDLQVPVIIATDSSQHPTCHRITSSILTKKNFVKLNFDNDNDNDNDNDDIPPPPYESVYFDDIPNNL
ncbi:unnamed protein product [Rotaria sp. Silwood2]|nr:unnamed protein product [Rotaria sp. Silwood2]CAF3161341.1 unnamed protein product [Rotaria sp. Silwood2]CAF3395292.1 unnamed protein product [Rotaria sp. Silwood2]CAF3485327.1 unnamed protein product [Rotaria sp. Silwood2]CAF4334487.1 unnamed protein product [Rotaria sp. Silwood2]